MIHQQSTRRLRVRHDRFKRTGERINRILLCRWKEKALESLTRSNHAKAFGIHKVPEEREDGNVDESRPCPHFVGKKGFFGHKICRANSLNNIKHHQVLVEIGSLATSPAVETGIAEALKIEIQDSTWRGTQRP